MLRALIIGYDPGTTSALAALDLHGNFVVVHSRKELPLAEAIAEAGNAGRPLIIASDREQPPEAVKKMAAAFSARVWKPERDLGVMEKTELVREIETENEQRFGPHERDALAAALACYKSLATGFSKVEDTLRALGLEGKAEDIKQLLLTKQAKNVAEAIEKILAPKREEVDIRTTPSGQLRIDDLLRKIKSLENTIGVQKAYIQRMEQKLRELEASRKQLIEERVKQTAGMKREFLKDKDMQLRETMIGSLRGQLKGMQVENERLRAGIGRREEFGQLLDEDRVPLAPVSAWSKDALMEADRDFGLRDKYIWVKNFAQGAQALRAVVALGVKGIVGKVDDETAEKLRSAGTPVITNLAPSEGKFWAWLEKKDFERALGSSSRSGFLGWLAGYKKRHDTD